KLAEFEGITVLMDRGDDYAEPHVHIRMSPSGKAVYSIADAGPLSGRVPGRAGTILEGWLVVREQELLDAWEALRGGFSGDIPVPPLG
ncbi:MAG: DUF4160 domain-containing protein, partial [Desulfobacterales bacterium]|nr:DUF4160 domain-containing protein [Desulfobacterales bacterium]